MSLDFLPFGFCQGILSGVLLVWRTEGQETDLMILADSFGKVQEVVVDLKVCALDIAVA